MDASIVHWVHTKTWKVRPLALTAAQGGILLVGGRHAQYAPQDSTMLIVTLQLLASPVRLGPTLRKGLSQTRLLLGAFLASRVASTSMDLLPSVHNVRPESTRGLLKHRASPVQQVRMTTMPTQGHRASTATLATIHRRVRTPMGVLSVLLDSLTKTVIPQHLATEKDQLRSASQGRTLFPVR